MYRLRNILDTCSIRVEASGQLVVLLGGGLARVYAGIFHTPRLSYRGQIWKAPYWSAPGRRGGEVGAPVMKRRLPSLPVCLPTFDRSIQAGGGVGGCSVMLRKRTFLDASWQDAPCCTIEDAALWRLRNIENTAQAYWCNNILRFVYFIHLQMWC